MTSSRSSKPLDSFGVSATKVLLLLLIWLAIAAVAENMGDSSSLKHAVQENLRGALSSASANKDDAPWYMYVSGTAPWCKGDCNDDDYQSTMLRPVMVPYLHIEYLQWDSLTPSDKRVASWSGNTDAFGKDCTIGDKALCVTQRSNDRTQAPWDFPACGSHPNTNSSVSCQGCTGCPKGSVDVGEWEDTTGGVCCLADYLYSTSIMNLDRFKFCEYSMNTTFGWKARRCQFDASKL